MVRFSRWLHRSQPPGVTDATAYGVWEHYQVGSGGAINSQTHALLWAGTAASVVDLHPAGFTSSVARDISSSGQVGIASSSGRTYAMLWGGTAASAINLHSVSFTDTYAAAIGDASQVGSGTLNTAGFPRHALLWRGTADSVVDLNPVGFNESAARDVSGDIQVGDGKGPATNFATHALLWHETAGSVVDLHPLGYSSSVAWSVEGNTQVGYGDGRALLWHGTAVSVVDLHSFLTNLPVTIVRSSALGVNSRGDVVGVGFDTNGAAHSLLWISVPEPSTTMLLAGILICSCGRPRSRLLRRIPLLLRLSWRLHGSNLRPPQHRSDHVRRPATLAIGRDRQHTALSIDPNRRRRRPAHHRCPGKLRSQWNDPGAFAFVVL